MYQNQNQGMNAQNQNIGAQQQNMGAQQNAQNASGSNRSNRTVVPQAKGALNQMKYEIASELGMSARAVEGRLYRVKTRLRAMLGGENDV